MAAGETLQHSMKNRCSKPVTLRLPGYIFLTSLQTIDKNQRNTRKKREAKLYICGSYQRLNIFSCILKQHDSKSTYLPIYVDKDILVPIFKWLGIYFLI